MFPYLVTGLLWILIGGFQTSIYGEDVYGKVIQDFKVLVLGNLYYGMGALWFLEAAFVASIENKIMLEKLGGYWILLFGGTTYMTYQYFVIPFNIQTGLIAGVFVWIGNMAYNNIKEQEYVTITIVAILTCITWISYNLIKDADLSFIMARNEFGSYPMINIAISLSMVWLVIRFSAFINSYSVVFGKLLAFLGRNS